MRLAAGRGALVVLAIVARLARTAVSCLHSISVVASTVPESWVPVELCDHSVVRQTRRCCPRTSGRPPRRHRRCPLARGSGRGGAPCGSQRRRDRGPRCSRHAVAVGSFLRGFVLDWYSPRLSRPSLSLSRLASSTLGFRRYFTSQRFGMPSWSESRAGLRARRGEGDGGRQAGNQDGAKHGVLSVLRWWWRRVVRRYLKNAGAAGESLAIDRMSTAASRSRLALSRLRALVGASGSSSSVSDAWSLCSVSSARTRHHGRGARRGPVILTVGVGGVRSGRV